MVVSHSNEAIRSHLLAGILPTQRLLRVELLSRDSAMCSVVLSSISLSFVMSKHSNEQFRFRINSEMARISILLLVALDIKIIFGVSCGNAWKVWMKANAFPSSARTLLPNSILFKGNCNDLQPRRLKVILLKRDIVTINTWVSKTSRNVNASFISDGVVV